jgi:amino acid adenylation domain-containing protein
LRITNRSCLMIDKTDGGSLRSGFVRQVNARPEAPALVVRGITKSYGELDHTARVWARAIQEAALRPPERVGVFAHRSEVSYVGTLAALFSGAAFVPLNPTFPAEKIAGMIEQADVQAILVDKAGAALLPGLSCHKSLPPLLMPEFESPQVRGTNTRVLGREQITDFAPLHNLPAIAPEDVAYLLFTSGSTGRPKGVPVTHGNAVHFLDVTTERYQIGTNDRFSQTFDQSFDLSVFDLFLAWNNGACVFSMAPIELLAPTNFINKNGLTVWFSVPSLPAHMIRRGLLSPGSMPGLRWSLFCGEPLPRRTAMMWQAAAPNSVVENLYGPTELTIACFNHRWNPETSPAVCHNDMVPIGVPYPGLAALVVDENLFPVNPGEFGELCVCGPQTTPGYWRDPEKTAEKYVDLPVSQTESRRFYRTGDRVARSSSGEYVFAGRTDHQIKILGHRVELGEIEAALRRGKSVEHAVASGWPHSGGGAERIVAFVSGESIDVKGLLKQAKLSLPPYAVPQEIFIVPEMPLNANGKVDRNALCDQLASRSSLPAREKRRFETPDYHAT